MGDLDNPSKRFNSRETVTYRLWTYKKTSTNGGTQNRNQGMRTAIIAMDPKQPTKFSTQVCKITELISDEDMKNVQSEMQES